MSTIFLINPRLTILTIGLISVAGLSSFVVLPRMEDPLLAERAALVLTALPGADGSQVEALITDPIEDELREVEEIKKLKSVSRSSLSTVTIELRDDVGPQETSVIWSRIRDKIADSEVRLPVNASKPKFEILEVAAYTRLIALTDRLGTTTAQAPSAILRRQAEDLREQLLAISGTKEVDIFGAPEEEIVVEIDPQQLIAIGQTVEQISEQIVSSDSRFSAGMLRSDMTDLLIEVSGEFDSVSRIAETPIQSGNDGTTLLLGDIATVRREIKSPPVELTIVNGKPAIVLACLIRPDQRIDLWHARSVDVIDAFSNNVNAETEIIDVFSQNGYVSDRLTALLSNLMIGASSVMLVILLLMGWRSAVIVGTALPLAAFMVLTGMRLLEIPIHQMSVTGLIIALGLLIDNAIVVVDEVNQKLQDGQSMTSAVNQTVRHLAIPLFGSTFTTALAFGPIALMPGPAGEFVGSIAINVMVAIFSSLLLAMTIVPALTGFLRSATNGDQAQGWLNQGIQTPIIARYYGRLLQKVLSAPWLGIALGIAIPLFGFIQARTLPEQFFPPADRNQIAIELELGAQASLTETRQHTAAIRELLLQDKSVTNVSWWLGRSAPPFYYNQIPGRRGVSQYAQALVELNSIDRLADRINRMQRQLDQAFPTARVLVRQLEQGPPFEAPIEVQIFGPDPAQLHTSASQIHQVLSTIPQVTHVRAEMSEPQARLTLNLDEQEVRLAGLSHQTVATQMSAALEGTTGGLILEGTEELPVRVRVGTNQRKTTDAIEALDVRSPEVGFTKQYSGVPLTVFGKLDLQREQSSITRENRRRNSKIQAYLEAGVLPAPVQAEFQKRMQAAGITLPTGYELKFDGESAQRNDAIGNLLASVGVLAVLMIAALVLSFRSFRLASVIVAVAVLSVGLGLGALWLFGYPFGFMAIIGTMGLVGVAINDSIVVLAAIQENPAAANGDLSAMHLVVRKATRHVVATSLTTIAGFLPLILAGGGFWPPLAVTIAGGVGGATILALIFAPSLYLLLMRRQPNLHALT